KGLFSRRPGHRTARTERHAVDPAALLVGRKDFALAVCIGRDHLAVVTTGDHALPVGSRGKDGASVHRYATHLALARHPQQRLLAEDEHRGVTEKMRRHDRRVGLERPGALDDRGFIGASVGHGLAPTSTRPAHATQLSKPSRIFSSGSLRPMKTMRLSRFSPSFHGRWWSPSRIMGTPWNTKRSSSPFTETLPSQPPILRPSF